MDEIDRRLILRRRALFVGSALAALGCGKGGAPPEHASDKPVVVVPAEPEGTDEEEETEIATDAGTERRVRKDAPSLQIPDGVSQTARQNYEHLAKTFGEAYDVLDDIETTLASCSIDDASCESRWRELAERQYEMEEAFRFFHICPGSSDEAKAFRERELAHRAYLDERRAEVWKDRSASSKTKFDEMVSTIRMSKPSVCLSFGCMDW